jgi:hypothetical protein
MDEQPEGPDLEAAHIEYITGDRPIDEVYDTMRDVEQNPMGAWQEIQQLFAEVARLREALEPFADVSDFLASETEGLSDDDVFNLKLAGSKFLLMTYTAKQFHDARAALEYKD